MGYTTYDFYKKKYYGDSVEESLFPKWNDRASEKLDFLTYGNITETSLQEYDEKIQKATCAIVDLMYQIEIATTAANAKDNTNVKSYSSGGESITYGSTETLVTKVLSDPIAQNRLLQEKAAEYLSGTGLLYAGY